MPEAGKPQFNRENHLPFLDLIRDSLFMNIENTHFPVYLSIFHSRGVGGLIPPLGGPFQALCVGSCGKSSMASRICIHSAPDPADGYQGEDREPVLTWDRRPKSCNQGHR